MNWSSSSAVRNRRAKGWTPQSSAATSCCGSSSAQVPTDERGMTGGPSLSPPVLAEFAAFRAFRSDAARRLPMAHDIARSHGVLWSDPVVFAAGADQVVGIGAGEGLKVF